MTPDAATKFLREAARYFGNRPTGGEDSAFWSNVANADNCNRIAKLIETMESQMSHPEVDAWENHRQELKRELIAEGMSPERADEEATNKVRREIRNGPPIRGA